ncbi:hypothetical protein D3C81_1569480 [compost metagenome]
MPRKVYLLTHHAALTPNTRFNGTEITTASRVSLSADRASGSKIASKNVPKPFFSACDTTITSGNSRNNANTSQPRLINTRREVALPRRAALAAALAPRDELDIAGLLQGVSMRRCSRLISSSRMKETTSISTPMAVAPV